MSLSEAYLAEDGRVVRRPPKTDLVGRLNEERAVRALTKSGWKPPGWFRGVRLATRHEDYVLKMDVIIITCDKGQLGVQIKSSIRAAHRFLQRKCPSNVVCVVLLDNDTDDVIRTKIFNSLKELRSKRKNRRRRRTLRRIQRGVTRKHLL